MSGSPYRWCPCGRSDSFSRPFFVLRSRLNSASFRSVDQVRFGCALVYVCSVLFVLRSAPIPSKPVYPRSRGPCVLVSRMWGSVPPLGRQLLRFIAVDNVACSAAARAGSTLYAVYPSVGAWLAVGLLEVPLPMRFIPVSGSLSFFGVFGLRTPRNCFRTGRALDRWSPCCGLSLSSQGNTVRVIPVRSGPSVLHRASIQVVRG